jgi:iron complex transport system substrate-binding protein
MLSVKREMKNIILVVLFLMSFVFAQDINTPHSTLHTPHSKVVSLAPAVTKQMIAMGVDSLLVGKTSYCPKDAGNDSTKIIGDVVNISGESVLALRPDVVLAGGLTNKSLVDRLQKTGVRVFLMPDPINYEQLCENFRNVAEICGVLPKADSILAETNEKYEQIKAANAELTTRPKIFIQLSTNPIYTIMKNTLGNEMITAAGGQNCFDLSGGAVVSREAVIAANPDMILVANMEKASEQEVAKWKKFSAVSAVKSNKVSIIDGYIIGSPTPVSFIEAIEKIREMK